MVHDFAELLIILGDKFRQVIGRVENLSFVGVKEEIVFEASSWLADALVIGRQHVH